MAEGLISHSLMQAMWALALCCPRGGGGEHIAVYFSRTISVPERNYCVTHRELLAAVAALQHFSSATKGQIALCLEQLQDYVFTVEHHAGKSGSNANTLSWRPCMDTRHCQDEWTEGAGHCAATTLKALHSQWACLCEHNGLLYHRWEWLGASGHVL